MATHTEPVAPEPAGERRGRGRVVVSWLTTTDHKKIGHLYPITSFGFFLVAAALAMLVRAEPARTGLQIVSSEQYDQAFTMHGTIMLLLFATPTFAGFANAVMPLQIGSPDVAFPRLNMLSYWLFLFGGLIVLVQRRLGAEGMRRPLGLRPLPGMGHVLPAAPPQFPHPAQDPLRVPRLRPASPGRGEPRRGGEHRAARGARRRGAQGRPALTRGRHGTPAGEPRSALAEETEGYLLAHTHRHQAQCEAEDLCARMPWLTTAQAEELTAHYVRRRLDVTRQLMLGTVRRADELRQEYEGRYAELRRALLRRHAAGACAVLVCAAGAGSLAAGVLTR